MENQTNEKVSTKQRIMAALFAVPMGQLTTEDIQWISTHLPDTKEEGTNELPFEAYIKKEFIKKKNTLTKSIGITDERFEEIRDIVFDASKNESSKLAVAIKVIPQLSRNELTYMMVNGIDDVRGETFHRKMTEGLHEGLQGVLDKLGIKAKLIGPIGRKNLEGLGDLGSLGDFLRGLHDEDEDGNDDPDDNRE